MTRPDDDREVTDSDESDDFDGSASPDSLPLEAEPADVLEQAQAVPAADDDEYR